VARELGLELAARLGLLSLELAAASLELAVEVAVATGQLALELGDTALAVLELSIELALVVRPVLLARLEGLFELVQLFLSSLELGGLPVDLGRAVA